MKIPDEIRKGVGFITYENKISGQFIPVGTFFFLGHDPAPGSSMSPRMYAVTAGHVINGLKKKGCDNVTLRMNPKIQDNELLLKQIPIDQWVTHPTDKSIDVAIFEMGIPLDADHLVIPFSMCTTAQTFNKYEVSLGDEIFISGLFKHHFGARRNIPIIRTGNLAALSEERVQAVGIGEIDALLVEVHSIGGLSGSPVFLNLGLSREIDGEVTFLTGGEQTLFLLGLMHGHFDSRGGEIDVADSATIVNDKINTGIGIVVPISKVHSIISVCENNNK